MLEKSETSLVGQWFIADGKVEGDSTCRRIEELVANHLVQVARSPDGWSCLYRDPSDGRLWERTYPHAEMHGGGAPALAFVTQEQAFATYGVAA
jgi:hypothetical protein